MTGRGLLGKWGPNHAADPIVTRWKTDSKGERVMVDGKPCLEFVAIKRKDTGEWAIPGVRMGVYSWGKGWAIKGGSFLV
jgi:ADP-ribose pyrophosphatase